jgi:pilin isopeptide linkage protein
LEEKNDGVENVKYDGTKYTITVTVVDDNAQLKATVKIEKDQNEVDSYGFTNIFTPDPVSVVITAQKKLTNHTQQTMGLDGFSFLLTDGTTPVTKISGTDGLAKFELTFDAVGTYTYKLSEVKGTVADMVYDETVYDITVTVTQDAATGALTATVSKTDNAVFTNVYGEPEDPTEPTDPIEPTDPETPTEPEEPPKTAEDFGLLRWTAMLTISAFSALAVLVIGKKKLQEQ